MKKSLKVLLATVMSMMLLFTSTMVFAGNTPADGDSAPSNTGFQLGTQVNPIAPGEAGKTAATIIGVMQWVGYAIAVGMLVYIGIKYIMASANEKADLKNSLIKYVIGAILIIGAATISGWIFAIDL